MLRAMNKAALALLLALNACGSAQVLPKPEDGVVRLYMRDGEQWLGNVTTYQGELMLLHTRHRGSWEGEWPSEGWPSKEQFGKGYQWLRTDEIVRFTRTDLR